MTKRNLAEIQAAEIFKRILDDWPIDHDDEFRDDRCAFCCSDETNQLDENKRRIIIHEPDCIYHDIKQWLVDGGYNAS